MKGHSTFTFDRNQIGATWAARGFSCDLWTDPPGQRWENSTHATYELVTVLEGQRFGGCLGRKGGGHLGGEGALSVSVCEPATFTDYFVSRPKGKSDRAEAVLVVTRCLVTENRKTWFNLLPPGGWLE